MEILKVVDLLRDDNHRVTYELVEEELTHDELNKLAISCSLRPDTVSHFTWTIVKDSKEMKSVLQSMLIESEHALESINNRCLLLKSYLEELENY